MASVSMWGEDPADPGANSNIIIQLPESNVGSSLSHATHGVVNREPKAAISYD